MTSFRSIFRSILILLVTQFSFSSTVYGVNEIGIYFDSEYSQKTYTPDQFPSMVTGYLVLKSATAVGGVGAWECKLGIVGPAHLIGVDLAGDSLNILSLPQFMVGVTDPPLFTTTDGEVLLATMEFYIADSQPATLFLGATDLPSLPVSMSYLDAVSEAVIPMDTYTGQPAVAFLNAGIVHCDVSLSAVNLGETFVGGTLSQMVSVTNNGMESFPLLVELSGDCVGFSLPGIQGAHVLGPGETWDIAVQFEPTSVGYFECTLRLGESCIEVPIEAYARAPAVSWIGPAEIDFDTAIIGDTVVRELTILNNGDVDFEIEASMIRKCSGFTIPPQSLEPITLKRTETWTVSVSFTPDRFGTHICSLSLGEFVPPIRLTGFCRHPEMAWTITPDPLELPKAVVGTSSQLQAEVRNDGEAPLDLDISLMHTSVGFTLLEESSASMGPGPYTLLPGETGFLDIRFTPERDGSSRTQLRLGSPIPPVKVLGESVYPGEFCHVWPIELEFDPTFPGERESATFEVTNVQASSITVTPLPSSPYFKVDPQNLTILPGETATFIVEFKPEEEGIWDCLIDLGYEFCSPIYCSAESPHPTNTIGIYFDTEFSIFDVIRFEDRTSYCYVALLGCTSATGVSGWECDFDMGTNAITIVHFSGLATNHGDNYSWRIELDEPLPYSPNGILLAKAYFQVGYTPITMTLQPLENPTLPGTMAFWTGEGKVLPLVTWTGQSEVAWINRNLSAPNGTEIAAKAAAPNIKVTLQNLPPAVTQLLPNVPNPFNPQTEIHFELEESGSVSVRIYDVTGRLVRTLVSESLAMGPHSRTWFGEDDHGRKAPSGAYYVRLETAGRTDTQKVMLLK